MRQSLILLFIVLGCSVVPLWITSAQMPEPPDDGPASEKLDQLRKIKLIEALDLTEDQATKLFTREKDNRKAQKELNEKRKDAVQNLHKMVKDGTSDEELLKGIQVVQSYSEQMIKNRNEFPLTLKDFLSIEQIAKMVVFEQRFASEVRRILESFRDRRPGGDGVRKRFPPRLR